MSDILKELSDAASVRTEDAKRRVPPEVMKARALAMPSDEFPFEDALRRKGVSLICEVKRASPSKGLISKDFDHVAIAKEYASAGADCISVLTEPTRFLGDLRFLKDISEVTDVPLLRKDFVVDEYMIHEAKCSGASSVLLICSILDDDRLRNYLRACEELGLSALVEAHDRREVERAVECGARIIGINNRDLRDFTVDIENGISLRSSIPDGIITVAESGIKDHADIARLQEAGFDAALIGETIMRSMDKTDTIRRLRFGDDSC
jgi:indole-3-glycerol phosphate synthase